MNDKSLFSPTLSCVPFTSHDDGNRLGMSANFLRQSLVLTNPELPYASTDYLEKLTAQSSFLIRAKKDGHLLYSDSQIVIWEEEGKIRTFKLPNSNWEVGHRPQFKAGDIIVRHRNIINDRYATGINASVLFIPYKGWNYEDAIVVTETGASKLRSISVEEYEIVINPNQIVTLFPTLGQHVIKGTELFTILDAVQNTVNVISLGAQKVSMHVKHTGVVEKIVAYFKKEALPLHQSSDMFLDWVNKYSISKEIDNIKKTLSKVDLSYSKTIKQYFPESYDLPSPHSILVKIFVRTVKQFEVGDKLANRHGNKGVCSIIVPDSEVRASDGWIPDLVLNPLGVISRMNVGQIIEMHIGQIIHTVKQRCLQSGDMNALFLLKQDLNALNEQISINNLTYEIDLYEKFNQQRVLDLCQKYEVPVTKKYEITSGYPFEAGYGNMYWFPLVHTADAKISFRADGPYQTKSLQPTSSDNIPAGQRLGEMEIWSYFAYEAYNNIKETLEYKADDILAKEAMLAHTKESGLFPVQPDGIYSNHLLKLYLHALTLDLDPESVISEEELTKVNMNLIDIVVEEEE